MGTKTRLGSYCTKRANIAVNLATSRKINTRLARPIVYVAWAVNIIFAAKVFVHTTKPWQIVCEKLVLIVALCPSIINQPQRVLFAHNVCLTVNNVNVRVIVYIKLADFMNGC